MGGLWASLRRKSGKPDSKAGDFLVVGLGNPGSEYAQTRHNVGFMILDALADAEEGRFGPIGQGEIWNWQTRGRSGILAKPQTYVNNSGIFVKFLLGRFKVETDNILIVHDDLTLEVGQYKFRCGGGSLGHNGLLSIEEKIGTPDFFRLRVGIGQPEQGASRVDWVLSPFSEDQMQIMDDVFGKCSTAVADFVTKGGVAAMNVHNKRTRERGKLD
ncbi:MAG: aminoacyl-tRNA hydrolase [Candidatus Coatesbacteria bacterium]|nr:aminoacyl-tRNA hydrolase [Candidatus Coatesbacteria bacterium]